MRSGQVVACSVSLLAAGFLLTRGFIGLVPGRPVFVLLGIGLTASAVIGLAIDHVEVRASRQRPEHALVEELNRSRRHGHALSVAALPCTDDDGHRLVGRMRTTDRAWRRRRSMVVLLPETDAVGAARFVRRVTDLASGGNVRVATFPDDALTVDGLMAALHPPVRIPLVSVDHDLPREPVDLRTPEVTAPVELSHAVGER